MPLTHEAQGQIYLAVSLSSKLYTALLTDRQSTHVIRVVIVKIVYVGAVFYAYSVSKSLPTAVFLIAVKAR